MGLRGTGAKTARGRVTHESKLDLGVVVGLLGVPSTKRASESRDMHIPRCQNKIAAVRIDRQAAVAQRVGDHQPDIVVGQAAAPRVVVIGAASETHRIGYAGTRAIKISSVDVEI